MDASRVLRCGAGDDDETLRKKRLLLVVVLAKAPVCPSLAVAYYNLGVPLAALVPVVYQALTVASVIVFLMTRNFERFRFQQALIIFVGPIALHYFLGGFVNSSGMILSAFLAPLIAILFHGGRQSWPWFVALWIVLIVLAVFDSALAGRAHMHPGVGARCPAVVQHCRCRLAHLCRHPLSRVAARCREGRAGVAQRAAHLTASELSLALARLEETNVALAEAGRQKSRFLASMSHELRTPLNAIIGYSEMLEEQAAELERPSFTQDLEKIHVSGRHLLGLIDNVLDLSKIEAGRMQMFAEHVDVAALVADLVTVASPLMTKKGNRLIVEHGSDLGGLNTDATKVRQVLLNLLSNSAKFTKRGTITLTAVPSEDGATMTFSVRDTGIGMTPEQLGRLFEEFSQAEAGTYRHFGGTGLGLALSRRFARILGGDVTVDSTFGGGSTFTFTVPREVPSPNRARDACRSHRDVRPAVARARQREDQGGLLSIVRHPPSPRSASHVSRDSALPEGRINPRHRQPETPAGAFAVSHALVNGRLKEGTIVVEASSGSTAISEAYFARLLGLPFVAVMPASTSRRRSR